MKVSRVEAEIWDDNLSSKLRNRESAQETGIVFPELGAIDAGDNG
jgi:hypothetical protein